MRRSGGSPHGGDGTAPEGVIEKGDLRDGLGNASTGDRAAPSNQEGRTPCDRQDRCTAMESFVHIVQGTLSSRSSRLSRPGQILLRLERLKSMPDQCSAITAFSGNTPLLR